jgi:aminodeoxychorismate lyase
MIVFINGKFVPEEEAQVSVFDRSFLYGDGLFETILITNSIPFRWDQHLARLQHGASFLGIRLPYSETDLREFIAQLLHRNQASEGLLRLTLSRGVGIRGYSPQKAKSPTVVISVHPVEKRDPTAVGPVRWRLETASLRLPADQPLAQFKTCNKLPQIMARAQVEATGADEALLLNTDGFVVEGATSNLFWIKQNVIHTPPLASGVLSGVTRAVVIELCHQIGIEALESNIGVAELLQSDGVFLSLSSLGVVEAACLDGHELPRSVVTRSAHSQYLEIVRRETSRNSISV